ncbi:MAG: hypothetical protein FWD52_08955 [Candidatus Bathyarchaeota archaeon]|nr:hypothetical protein [Candidatus Termiticorpusculum sp.]
MSSVRKLLALTLIILVLSGFIVFLVNSVNVYAASKPSVPQLSVKFIDNSYDVPPTQTTDPYTGVTTTQPGYHVSRIVPEVTIKNQPFTGDGRNSLFYLVQAKGYFGGDNDWHTVDPPSDGSGLGTGEYIEQSDSGYTVFTSNKSYDSGVQVDFRVQAVIGHRFHNAIFWTVAVETSSDWSKIQTFTVPGKPSVSPTQTTNFPSTPTTSDPHNPPPQNPLSSNREVIFVATCIITILITIIIYQYTHKEKPPQPQTNQQYLTP